MTPEQEKALRIALGDGKFDVAAANKKLAPRQLPSILPRPAQTKGPMAPDLANPLGIKMGIERETYARPLGDDPFADLADLVSGATFGDGLAPDASQASTLGLAATAGVPGMLGKTGRGVYSKLAQVVRDKFPPAIKSESLLNLARKYGVKEEEIVATGLDKLVVPGQRVTKEQIEEAVAKGTPKVETKVLGNPPLPTNVNDWPTAKIRAFEDWHVNRYGRTPKDEDFATKQFEWLEYRGERQIGTNPTKFSQHTLPGGENYRETLIHLPRTQGSDHTEAIMKVMEMRNREMELQVEIMDGLDAVRAAEGTPQYAALQAAHNKKVSEFHYLKGQRQALEQKTKASHPDEFRGSHFDTPNVLVHALHTDRATPEGLNVRFLDEVQSDWHQKGKVGGYTQPRLSSLPEGFEVHQRGPREFIVVGPESGRYHNGRVDQTPEAAMERFFDGYSGATRGAVPDAPFKSDAQWGGLMLKQQLTDAAEKGLDGLAWNKGDLINDRYKLSHKISKINYKPDPNNPNGGMFEAWDHNGNQVMTGRKRPEELPDYIGKDAANRLLTGQNAERIESGIHAELAGEDLNIGGRGMRQFYDEVLPAEAERLLKPFGGKVEQGTLKGEWNPNTSSPSEQFSRQMGEEAPAIRAWLAKLTPEIRQQILEKGFPLFALMMALRGQQQEQAPGQVALQNVLGDRR